MTNPEPAGIDPQNGRWQDGDVAVYSYAPYPGEEQVRVTVGFSGGYRIWLNVATVGVVSHVHIRDKGGLTHLLRDGQPVTAAESVVGSS